MKQMDSDTLVEALRILAHDIHCEGGVANETIREAADRIETLNRLAIDVLRASSRGDHYFIPALHRCNEQKTIELRTALVRLGDQLREWEWAE